MTLEFAGGPVEIPPPTREALLLSARQWVTAAYERTSEMYYAHSSVQGLAYVQSACAKALAALKEAEEASK